MSDSDSELEKYSIPVIYQGLTFVASIPLVRLGASMLMVESRTTFSMVLRCQNLNDNIMIHTSSYLF